MAENQFFNLEKIKELTNTIDKLQAKVYQLKDASIKFENYKEYAIQDVKETNFLSQIEGLTNIIDKINSNLEEISKNNISHFIDFKEGLVTKYKERYQDQLKKLKLTKFQLSKIGLYLIENKMISKTITNFSYVLSVDVLKWIEILDSLKQNSLFVRSVKKVGIYYETLIQERLRLEKSKIPKDTDKKIIKNYEKAFQDNHSLSFKEFYQLIKDDLTQKELKTRKEFISQTKEREELEILKKKQEEHKETYEDYMKLSDREFERKIRRKSREKLKRISNSEKENKAMEISEEVSEKIKKFKSKFDKSFEEKYLIQKDDEIDPLDLIRERKTKKEKEYKKYKNHFENS